VWRAIGVATTRANRKPRARTVRESRPSPYDVLEITTLVVALLDGHRRVKVEAVFGASVMATILFRLEAVVVLQFRR